MDGIQWCRDRLLVPGHPLAASLLFVPSPDRERILSLKAVLAEISAIPESSGDDTVVRAKLAWWEDALTSGSEHPALLALAQSGAQERLNASDLLAFLHEVVGRCQGGTRFERYEELWAHCLALGGGAARLEASLISIHHGRYQDALESVGGAGYLFRVVRDMAVDARQNRWFAPLDLQAQFQISRTEVAESKVGSGWDGLVRTLIERGVRAGGDAVASLSPSHRHLAIAWAVDYRLAVHLMRRPRKILSRRLLPGHMGNVWAAWRAARRL
ncbi:MAG: squalene/phytoene synthase family protein [Wenzhouxiangella sp.]|jgi:phytoene/squalene synthetase|nr:squalene/phytoene synthase family protein [Wenzhouxiangella sp.]